MSAERKAILWHHSMRALWVVLPRCIKVALYLAHRQRITQRIAATGRSW